MVPTEILPLCMVVIDHIREGYTLTRACRQAGVSIATYRRHVFGTKELQDLHDAAVQEHHDAMADALADPFGHELYGETDPQKAAITSRNLQWLLARRAPKQYGDKSTIEVTHRADETLLAALERGRQQALSPPIIDAVYTDVPPPDEMDPETAALIYG
jgi:hypothetical protein